MRDEQAHGRELAGGAQTPVSIKRREREFDPRTGGAVEGPSWTAARPNWTAARIGSKRREPREKEIRNPT